MTWDEVFCNTFKAIGKRIAPQVKQKMDFMVPSWPMVEACRANQFDFFQPFIKAGALSDKQMHHAAKRYQLGKTKSGMPIFWMIDDMMMPLDAHIGNSWISQALKAREPLLQYWPVHHCLFGQHLLEDDLPVSIVESEQTAVILNELFPENIWLAYATISHLTPEFLSPLVGRTVTIYPRTDPNMNTYVFFLDYANIVRQHYDIDLRIDTTLEQHATADQKERCIDIVDFLLDSL